jgi:hypothetical protein
MPSVRPLLTVAAVTLAACGSSGVPAAIQPDPEAVTPPAATAVATANATAGMTGPAPEATPRVMPNGRPACGNVAMRAPPCDAR